jgi:hypothetical protein
MGFSGTFSAASALLLLAGPQAEPRTYSLKDALQICSHVQNPVDRLACLEGLARSSPPEAREDAASGKGESPPRAPATASEQRVAPTATAPATASAQRAAEKEERRRLEAERHDQARKPYDAVVMRAWGYSTGAYYIALTNGEIWKVDAGDKVRPVKDSEVVELRPGLVGSWFMQFKSLKRPMIRVNLVE